MSFSLNTFTAGLHASARDLPIIEVLADIVASLADRHELVLEAPPGAGKTTLAPLALLNEAWLQGQRILMLEPRRIAARSAAERMASLLNEPVGQTVGYRVRLDSKVSAATRIEVVTEGILTRYLQSDPSLEGIGLIIFDEFHERSLDADLGLALALQGRRLFREPAEGELPLKLLVMSATLDGAGVAELLTRGGLDGEMAEGSEAVESKRPEPARIIRSQGRQYPVDVHYRQPQSLATRGGNASRELVSRVVETVCELVALEQGSLLVFLPGQGEIRRVQQQLEQRLLIDGAGDGDGNGNGEKLVIAPLYGDLSLAEQRRAIAPLTAGRKIVLATTIAESSLTIEGVTLVVDSGLTRAPVFDPNTGMTRLDTRRVSRAASVQRMGRAGRMQAGNCYRLWSASQQEQLLAQTPAEIQQTDLAPLALQLLGWGIADPAELDWLDLPPAAPYQQALDLLQLLGACNSERTALTEHGERMASLPLHPRLAHMLLVAVPLGLSELALELAALLSERDLLAGGGGGNAGVGHTSADIDLRLSLLRGDTQAAKTQRGQLQRLRQQIKQYRGLLAKLALRVNAAVDDATDCRWQGLLLACAYPDRIASRRQQGQGTSAKRQGGRDYRLSNGRMAQLQESDGLARADWLVAAHLGGMVGGQSDGRDRIFMAAELDSALFDTELAERVEERELVSWDESRQRFVAERQRRIGSLLLAAEPLAQVPAQAKQDLLLAQLRKQGLEVLSWSKGLRQWQARVNFLHGVFREDKENPWPDLADKTLLASLETWLAPQLEPLLASINKLADFNKLDLAACLALQLPWPLPKQLDELAPTHLAVPSGSRIPIDYSQSPPVLAVRLQEMFGCGKTPSVVAGRVPLLVHLLSPAQRPLQITQDLIGFWQGSYAEVKKDMKGRYPKHYWPDDPLQAAPTARAKPRR